MSFTFSSVTHHLEKCSKTIYYLKMSLGNLINVFDNWICLVKLLQRSSEELSSIVYWVVVIQNLMLLWTTCKTYYQIQYLFGKMHLKKLNKIKWFPLPLITSLLIPDYGNTSQFTIASIRGVHFFVIFFYNSVSIFCKDF